MNCHSAGGRARLWLTQFLTQTQGRSFRLKAASHKTPIFKWVFRCISSLVFAFLITILSKIVVKTGKILLQSGPNSLSLRRVLPPLFGLVLECRQLLLQCLRLLVESIVPYRKSKETKGV